MLVLQGKDVGKTDESLLEGHEFGLGNFITSSAHKKPEDGCLWSVELWPGIWRK